MTIDAFPPGLLLILGALLLPLLRGRMREIVTPLLPLAVLGYVWSLPEGVLLQFEYLGMNVEPVEVDALSRLFATIFTIMASAGALYAIRQSRFVEIVAAFIYGGGAVGVAFAGDLITIFVFWEIMALASTMVLWAAGTGKAWKASFRYLVIHLLGGVVLMAGIVAHVQAGAGTDFTAMKPESVGTWLILIGFLINAAAPPLSAWLADAYPEASPGGMVFLSA
ncbi:MAG: Na+/H+ antiporter subunit D, partial [Alphaproteobacteria bacterium]|nr:Na+/H+ antiporter subunit D [Alphaproteobacteria bacterium]